MPRLSHAILGDPSQLHARSVRGAAKVCCGPIDNILNHFDILIKRGIHTILTNIVARKREAQKQKTIEQKSKAVESRKHLYNVRVVQRNLVYVTGLPAYMAEDEVCVCVHLSSFGV